MSLTVEQFGDVTRLRMSSPGSRAVGLDVSAYVVDGVMIDSGFHRVRDELRDAVLSLGVRGAIITHWHEDHAGNVPMLAELRLPIRMRGDTDSILRANPDIPLYRRVVWGRPPRLAANVSTFDLGSLECIHTPGHSTDHQVVWDPGSRTLFSGDLWLGVRSRMFHTSEDPYEIVSSLEKIRALAPERMFDAHRGLVERPVAAIDARISWLSDTLATIERRLAEGWSERRILNRILDGEEFAGRVSRGEYSRRNLIRAVKTRSSSRTK